MAFAKDQTHRVDMGGLELIVDSIRDSTGTALAATGDSVTPQTAPADNAGVAVVAATITATTGSLPSQNGTTVISDTSTPTAVELLDAVCELRKNVADLVTENATFKTSINLIISTLTTAGVFT